MANTAVEREWDYLISRAEKKGDLKLASELRAAYQRFLERMTSS